MNRKIKRSLVLAGLSLVLIPLSGALTSQGSAGLKPLSNAQLDARHPSTLAGRGTQMQTGYVDLYAPFSAKETRLIEGYRGPEGARLPEPVQAQ